MRKLGHVALIVGALLLTVANSGAPPVRVMTRVEARSGDIELTLDARAYVDRPFMLVLPGGEYRSVTLTLAGEETPILSLTDDDPRLKGYPIRLALLAPSKQVEGKRYRLVVVAADGRQATADFTLNEVLR